jgi:hypothetical protein
MFIACLNLSLSIFRSSYFKYFYRSIPLPSFIKQTTTNLVVTGAMRRQLFKRWIRKLW